MIVSIKDGIKFVGVSIVCFCAVFVCTFFVNYYIDVLPLRDSVSAEIMPLYEAQLATAKMTTAITGGFLSVIAVIMLLFYVKLYFDANNKAIGICKAMGYSDIKIASNFLVFGGSVFIGCALGFGTGWAFMSQIYKSLTIDGLAEVLPKFHVSLLLLTVLLPTILFSGIAFLYAIVILKKPVLAIIKGEIKTKEYKPKKSKGGSFLKETAFGTLRSKKSLAFFVAFSAFCFSAMVQMGLSMEDLVEGTMGMLILIIGVVLAVVSMLMAMTSSVKQNSQNIAVMKAMGYHGKEVFTAVFLCYIPLVVIGFAVGTGYQYGLLSVMINVIFKNVVKVPEYSFNVPVMLITLALFIVAYSVAFCYFWRKALKTPIKEIMSEN